MLKVYDNGDKTVDRYTIIINNDVFAMSSDANMPNGVNMCISSRGSYINLDKNKEIVLGDLSKGVLIAIIYRLLQYIE